MQHSPLSQANSAQQPWNGGEPQGIDIYPSNMSYSSYGGYDGVDSHNYSYGGSDMVGGSMAELSSTPPITSFAASGLPFRGLEFIRNYGSASTNGGGGYSMEQDSLWHSYDPGAFEVNPDLPFTLGDMISETH